MTGKPTSRAYDLIRSDSLWPYLLISLLIHGLAVVGITHLERSHLVSLKPQPITKQQQENTPLEFIVVPPEKPKDKPPETQRRAVNNSVAKGKVTSQLPPSTDQKGNTAIDSSSQSSSKVASSPAETKPPETVKPQPQPVKPTTTPTSKEQPSPQKTEANSDVATRLPPQPKPVPPTPQPTDSGAASLLGQTYQKSFQDDFGSSFFNLQANASEEAPYAQLEAQQDDLAPYFDEIRRRVKRNWQPFSPGQQQYTVLNFAIQRNGQITGLKVVQTSGNEQVDQDALKAVQQSAPFDALPQSFKRDRLEIQFSFNIYIHN
ncbi:outer membrane transport energization protein TonB [Stanieria cyanosphaera PCC 7437]|uniref:Outer membrane transport energization protein TonB n=1 Tax=Stanieria cyanosphaera (strain ATCC 29371 / PCC 7437) TaxID=111780 RepID=K9XN03_STAC7|nr:TonB family protein [Stanieria cyanosphaera]AFZ33898.1 outer membrane transport energization protein TonB [Stanieria cyanosphaera PCC 7437]